LRLDRNNLSMNFYLRRTVHLFFLFFIAFLSQAQVTNTYTSSATWTVQAGMTSITIKVYGGAGGIGGLDCGNGCSNAAAGPVGYVLADYNVTPGDVVGIYPGGKGVNGSNNVQATGGGSGGADTYPSLNFNGGNGGNAGGSGSSGGGGGGGAASIITINSTIKIVAGGAGGGGGMANMAGSGLAGSSSTSSNGTNTGGNGTTPGGDGGGGGGGGGGQFASAGGGVHAAGGESAGDGGFRGGNSVSGASTITTNGNIAWTSAGQIEITHPISLPVTWLSFTATKQSSSVLLSWSTATEQNTKDYKVQHSINGVNWNDIGIVPAAGNSNTVQQYNFVDQNPASGLNYYRLLQLDLDGKINYSKVVSFNFSDAEHMLKIYPNPVVNGTVTVSLKQSSIVGVYNSIGIKLMQKEFTAGEHLFKLSQLSKGTYYMKVKDEAVLFVIQ
jgi:Secretion system C-terminal sorting domain